MVYVARIGRLLYIHFHAPTLDTENLDTPIITKLVRSRWLKVEEITSNKEEDIYYTSINSISRIFRVTKTLKSRN